MTHTGQVKLCDFGLVRTRNTTAGTPQYMAPELLEGGNFSRVVDVYAFGIVVAEVLHREVFLLGYDLWDIKRKVCAEKTRPRLPSGVEYPKEIRNLLEKCWSPQVEKRPEFKEIVCLWEQDVMSNAYPKYSDKYNSSGQTCSRRVLEGSDRSGGVNLSMGMEDGDRLDMLIGGK